MPMNYLWHVVGLFKPINEHLKFVSFSTVFINKLIIEVNVAVCKKTLSNDFVVCIKITFDFKHARNSCAEYLINIAQKSLQNVI